MGKAEMQTLKVLGVRIVINHDGTATAEEEDGGNMSS